MWKYARGQAKSLVRDKRGMSSLEMVIAILIFIVLFAAFVDIAVIGIKFNTTTQAVQYVTRVAAVQGGIMNSTPTGYPGGSANYVTRSEMISHLNEVMGESGLEPEDWSITLNGVSLKGGQHQADYMQSLQVRIRVNYEWQMLSGMLPGNFKFFMENQRSTVSEFKYSSSGW